MRDTAEAFPIYRAALCGLLAMLAGVGIARFGYAAMVPALVSQHWFSASTAFWLGTVNLLGYLLGALALRGWRRRIYPRAAMAGLVTLTGVSLMASGWDGGVIYFGFWRLISGITGGALMVMMAAVVVARAPPARRGAAGGITFAGMGTGITLSGLLIPVLLHAGLPVTWVALGGFCLAAAVVVAWLMPDTPVEPAPRHHDSPVLTGPVAVLLTGYTLCALGFVPHMLFLASFVAIFLHRGVTAGANVTAVMGIAAAVGPPVLGRLADRFGFLTTLGLGYLVMAAAVALPLFTGGMLGLLLSAFGVGAVALGAVMLTSGALAGMVAPARLAASWALATISYAVAQALVAGGFSAVFHATGSYRLLFAVGSVATLGSALLVAMAGYGHRRAGQPAPDCKTG